MEDVMRLVPGPARNRVQQYLADATAAEVRARENRFLHSEGWTPVGEYDPRDIFLFGFPKSGTHWLQTLVACIQYGLDLDCAPLHLITNVVPGIGVNHYYRRYRTPMAFKGHELPAPIYQRVVYLIRDGRDALASRAYHRTALRQKQDPWQIRDKFGTWHEHVEAWLSNPYDAEMLVIRYEDLKSNGHAELQRICEFLGEDRSDAFLDSLYRKASIETLREKETHEGHTLQGWPRDKPFYRRGEVGSYQDEVPGEVLAAFLAVATPTLERCGYSVESPDVVVGSGPDANE